MIHRLRQVVGILLVLSLLNVFSAILIAVALGGSATNGKVEGNHYFIGDRGHFSEVPRWIWFYSKFHMTSMFVSGLVFFAAYVLLSLLKRPRVAS